MDHRSRCFGHREALGRSKAAYTAHLYMSENWTSMGVKPNHLHCRVEERNAQGRCLVIHKSC